MRLTFLVSLLAVSLLYLTLIKLELTSKHARAQVRRLRRLLEAESAGGAATSTPLATVPAKPTYD